MRVLRVARQGSVGAALAMAGCGVVGPAALQQDHMDYAQAISDTAKQQTLLNAVKLRYGDLPSFLAVNTVIASYTVEASGLLGLNAYPDAVSGNFASVSGTLHYTEHPTFTFTPLTGEALAQSSVRPLSPADLLPLAQSGLPIDILFRLGVQSIGALQNAMPYGGSEQAGSPGFFELLAELRTLQMSGGIAVRFQKQGDTNQVFLSFSRSAGAMAKVRALLGLPATVQEVEVVYGRSALKANQLAVLTRPVTGVLAQIGSQIEVPDDDLRTGRTMPSLPNVGRETRPVVIVHQGDALPAGSYAAARYRGHWFWIAGEDYDSKVAFTVVELLISLAQGGAGGRGPILTLPAG